MRMKKLLKYSVIVLTIIITGIYFTSQHMKLSNSLYSEEAITVMKNMNVVNAINKTEYSKTIEAMLLSGDFKEQHVDAYFKIDYTDNPNFVKSLNFFIEQKYSPEVINYIYTLSGDNLELVMNSDFLDLDDFIPINNLEIANIERYHTYKDETNLDLQTSVTRVNLNLDIPFYSDVNIVENPASYQVLINKYNRLPNGYIPNNLIDLNGYPNQKLESEAATNFLLMIKDAKLAGHDIEPFSTYRSEVYQETLYSKYVESDGVDLADTYSARPGHSEHQTGLAVDIRSVGEISSLNDKDILWVIENAHKYGFILRYLEETSFITGYTYEPWHLRYVQKDIALDIINKKITFDEYFDLYLKNTI